MNQKKSFWKKCWSVWAKTMGSKISDNDIESDIAALIRSFWWLVNIITCFFIIANAGKSLGLWLKG